MAGANSVKEPCITSVCVLKRENKVLVTGLVLSDHINLNSTEGTEPKHKQVLVKLLGGAGTIGTEFDDLVSGRSAPDANSFVERSLSGGMKVLYNPQLQLVVFASSSVSSPADFTTFGFSTPSSQSVKSLFQSPSFKGVFESKDPAVINNFEFENSKKIGVSIEGDSQNLYSRADYTKVYLAKKGSSKVSAVLVDDTYPGDPVADSGDPSDALFAVFESPDVDIKKILATHHVGIHAVGTATTPPSSMTYYVFTDDDDFLGSG
ncbi:MAG: hypothetical protein AAB356_08360, partial [Deltaproteobacteria bacterium]